MHSRLGDIRATGRTIVYSLSHKIGHLALFVSAKVGAKQDEQFVQLMDVINNSLALAEPDPLTLANRTTKSFMLWIGMLVLRESYR